ncbi:MAG: hypothetical protein AB7F22_10600 [Reyranella sp.]|uniref:hypothetical protein n=1 Tax=Reyranella sp. TaxID=1929291 RepID=UPI003D0B82F6
MAVLYIFAVCSPDEADTINAAANEFFSDSGPNLRTPMSADGTGPATKMGCGAWITPATLAALNSFIAGQGFSTLQTHVFEAETHEAVAAKARDEVPTVFGVRPIELAD